MEDDTNTCVEIRDGEGPVADVEAPIEPEGKRFRINAKKFLLTYSQVSDNLYAAEAIDQFKRNIGVEKYVISWEKHRDGGKHFHVILLLNKKIDVRRFDLSFEGRRYGCSCKRITKLVGAVDYVCKDRQFYTNIKHVVGGSHLTRSEFLLQQCDEVGVEETAAYYLENHPEDALQGKGISQLVRNLKAAEEVKQKIAAAARSKKPSAFTLDDFNLPDIVKYTSLNSLTL